jgi:predicted ester cyclase
LSEQEESRAIVRRWIETFNNRDTQGEADVRAPGYVAHAPGLPGPLDSEAWTQFIASFAEAFPDLRLTVEDVFSAGDMVAPRVAFRGTHRGEFQGIPPTDKQVAFTSIEIDRMVDGKVQEHWFEMDLLGLMGQLGAIPEPEHPEEGNPT